jgi:hypothetical protein
MDKTMAFDSEKRVAARLLAVVENGTLPIADTKPLMEEADPALVYLLFGWLRARYHSGHSASEGVLGRIVALCSSSSVIARKVRSGEQDAIVQWFEETYAYRDLDRDAFISLIVDKLEG